MTSGVRSVESAWPTTITRLRGSPCRRVATSSRQALSTLLRRARLRGKPPEMQVVTSATRAPMRTEQLDSAVPPRPSETRTVTVMVAGGVTPVVSSVASAPVPEMRPALVVQV